MDYKTKYTNKYGNNYNLIYTTLYNLAIDVFFYYDRLYPIDTTRHDLLEKKYY